MHTGLRLDLLGVTMAVGLLIGAVARPIPVQAQTGSIVIQNYMFQPPTLSVPVGTTVTWVNHDPVAHTSTSDSGIWDSGVIQPGASFSRTFSQSGTYLYHCHIHPFMHGAIVVGASPQLGALTVSVSPSTVTTGSTATVTGNGFTPDNWAFAFWRRPDGSTRGIWRMTNPAGMFSFRLGFAPRHGTGVELVTAFDRATGRWAPFTSVTVLPGPIAAVGQLSASPNPASNGGTAVVSGIGFTPGGLVFVQWRRPDGTMGAIRVRASITGAFAFGFLVDRRHGCGPRVFMAFDVARGRWSAPYTLAVQC